MQRDGGFSLAEGIGSLILFAAIMAALTWATSALFKTQSHPSVSYGGAVYTLAPSFSDFNQAVSLHAAFAQAVDQADSVIVLGGARSHPVDDPDGPASVLALTFTDTSLAAGTGSDPFQAYSSWDQRSINSAQFAPYLSTTTDAADFTILTVQGLSRITSITQQRRHTATINGENVVLYEVTHQTVDWSSGSPVLTANGTTLQAPTYSYRIYYDLAEDNWTQAPGAAHTWFRADPTWDRDQEGPTRIVFADPYVLAGRDGAAQVTAVSRFVYFIPASR